MPTAIHHTPSTVSTKPEDVTMNHSRDANVPIYLGLALLRLSFSPRGRERRLLCPSPPISIRVIKEDRYLEVEGTPMADRGPGLTNSSGRIDDRQSSSGLPAMGSHHSRSL